MLMKTKHERDPKMKKHLPYNKLEGFKKENGITNAMIAEVLSLSETSIIQKNNGTSDYYIGEVKLLQLKLGIPLAVFLS